MTREEKVANELLKIKAVFLSPSDPFTWASGIKSPIYCDNRLIISYPESRELVETEMVNMIKEYYPSAEYIVGTSTAGIPHAAIVATKMNKPMAYVRSKVKDHGRAKHIEGFVPENAKVVVIEDLMSTGGSSIEVVNILRNNKINVLGIASIFTYNLETCKNNLEKANVINHSLSNFNILVKFAHEQKYVSEIEYRKLLAFQKDPNNVDWTNIK
mgnify:CR=1 FL=1